LRVPDGEPGYENGDVVLTEEVSSPSYAACLDWMRDLPDGRAVSFDIWARGNFTRRLIYNREQGVTPLLVQASSVGQIRWAYRRLALLGVPVEFLYTGPISAPQRVAHLYPFDSPIDCGWGYIAALGDPALIRDRRWFLVIGTSRLMPEEIPTWLVEEASGAFLRGDVFVSPSELIGMSPDRPADGLTALSDVTGGVSISPELGPALAALDLEMPFVDGLTPADFDRLLTDFGEALEDFRAAFRELMSHYHESESAAKAAISQLRDEVEILAHSARAQRFRDFVARCRGKVRTIPTLVGVLTAVGAGLSGDPFTGAAATLTAGGILWDIWKQARALQPNLSGYRLRLFWQLGVHRARGGSKARLGEYPKKLPTEPEELGPYHWLCPPSNGMLFAAVKK